MKILIVEDDHRINQLLEYNLRREGHQVLIREDAQFEDYWLQRNAPDLIIMDWNLPGKQGVDRCLELKLNPKFKRLPVIILSARDRISEIEKALSQGADGYITKPFLPGDISSLLERQIAKMDPRRLKIPRDSSLSLSLKRWIYPLQSKFGIPGRESA